MALTHKQATILQALQNESKQVISNAKAGKISKAEAADKILEIRDKMESLFRQIQSEINKDMSSLK